MTLTTKVVAHFKKLSAGAELNTAELAHAIDALASTLPADLQYGVITGELKRRPGLTMSDAPTFLWSLGDGTPPTRHVDDGESDETRKYSQWSERRPADPKREFHADLSESGELRFHIGKAQKFRLLRHEVRIVKKLLNK